MAQDLVRERDRASDPPASSWRSNGTSITWSSEASPVVPVEQHRCQAERGVIGFVACERNEDALEAEEGRLLWASAEDHATDIVAAR